MTDRTIQLSPYWAEQAGTLLTELDGYPAGDIPSIIGRAHALAETVTRLWNDAKDEIGEGR